VVYAVTEGFVTPGTEDLAARRALCPRHLDIRQRELFWHSHSRGYEAGKAEWEGARAEERNRREALTRECATKREEPRLVDAAVQRLVGEARRLVDPHPKPRSPSWIGRDLEVEGWDRKMLVSALAKAVEDGDLIIEDYQDAARNQKRAVRPAPTGVVEDVFA
jgi:hypothetical protein